MSLRGIILAAQAVTFIFLGGIFLAAGEWRLGLAQLCLAAVTVLIYA